MSHALFAPSAASRWLVCPLTVKLSAMFPDTSTDASRRGTLHHDIAATKLERGEDSGDNKMQMYLNAVRDEPGELFVERKLVVVPGKCWGTADAIKWAPHKLSLFDLKWGKSMVHATNNPQLLTYGVGVLREFPLPRDTPVDLVIVQPNATTGWPVKRWEVTAADILAFRPKIERAIEAAEKPDPVGVPGAHCYWCPGKMHCKAYLVDAGKKKS